MVYPGAKWIQCWNNGAKSHSHSEYSLSANTPLERAQPSKPEVAPKPVIMRQPSVLAPYSQIRTHKGSLLLPSAESPKEPDLGSSAGVPHPFHSETGSGNRNLNDVIPNVGREQSAYSGAQLVGPESCSATQPTAQERSQTVALKHYSDAQPTKQESCSEAQFVSQRRSQSEESEFFASKLHLHNRRASIEPSSNTVGSCD